MCALIHQTLLYCYIAVFTAVFPKPAAARHPLHVSTTNIEYNAKDNKLEVIYTLFTDDFETALNKQYNTKIDLSKPAMHDAMDKLVISYIAANAHIKANGANTSLNYLGFEVKDAQVDVYLESEKIPAVRRVDADITLLHNIFTDQINLVHITVNGVRKSEKLDFPQKKVSQTF